ncbi:MAG: ABC transporter ATP-binding protein [Thermodesulfobacteriota bacterium]
MLLDIAGLNLSFYQDSGGTEIDRTQVLFDVDLKLERGRTCGLVGESGSGKSVTALSVLRLLEETSAVSTSGSIRFEDRDILQLPMDKVRKLRGNRISMIFQEPMTSLNPVYSVGNQLIEPLTMHQGMTRHEAEKEAVRLLSRVSIPDGKARMKSFPHQLSGGQRQRIMIAMALACNPSLLIADEPTTALDVTIQAQILELIRSLQDELNMAVLLITHDLAMVKHVADHVSIMQSGRVVEQGETAELFSNPRQPYTRHLLNAVPEGKEPPEATERELIRVRNLNCHFHLKEGWVSPWKRRVKVIKGVDEVDLTIREGSTCGVVGESGSGKTTLGMAILRLTRSRGVIEFDGQDLQTLTARAMRPLRSELQVVFQDPFSSLSPRLTVAEIIEEGLRVHNRDLSRAQRSEIVVQTLSEVGLESEFGLRYPHEFSGGQRQRIAIARAIVLKPRFLILDEPTSALDMTIQKQIIDLLSDLQKRYKMTYLFISHDLKVVRAISDQIVVMQDGRIVEAGEAAQVFESPSHPYTKKLFRAALDHATA